MRIYLILALMLAAGCATEAPTITIVGADAAVQADVLEAVARFEDAGLELPDDVWVVFEGELCSETSKRGYYSYADRRVTLCEGYLPFVPTHELAHAWIHANVTQDMRQAFMDVRGWDEWAEDGASWQERAYEDAAFVLQQGVTVAPMPYRVSDELANRMAAFEVLTGVTFPAV